MQKKRDRTEYNRKWYLAHKETENAGSKKYYAENTDKCKELSRDWRQNNPEMVKEQKHRHTMKYLDKHLSRIIEWKRANPELARQKDQEYRRKVKQDFINAYGGKCECCGVDIFEFLTCEHLNNSGKVDRQVNRFLGGIKMYLKAKREGYPKDKYTCLCMNCNFAGRYGKKCPHQMNDRAIHLVHGMELLIA